MVRRPPPASTDRAPGGCWPRPAGCRPAKSGGRSTAASGSGRTSTWTTPKAWPAFRRPFKTPERIDVALFARWRRAVGPGDAIICLGDVAVHGVSGRRLRRLREAPGWKILVVGNHDPEGSGSVDIDGFDEIYSTLYMSLTTVRPLATRLVGAGTVPRDPRLRISSRGCCDRPGSAGFVRSAPADPFEVVVFIGEAMP